MKVELLLADDTELRKYIKELIKAEVLAIARSEVVNIIKDVVGDRVAGEEKVTGLMREIIKKETSNALGATDYSIRETAKTMAREEVRDLLQRVLQHEKVADLFKKPE